MAVSGGHVFVSYGRADGAYVRRLVTALTRAGVDLWYDQDLAAGQPWKPQLLERIESCRALLLVMSTDAAVSEWVAREVAHAREYKKRILPLWVEGEILFGLNPMQVVDVRDGGLPPDAFVNQLQGMAPLRRVIRHQIGVVPGEADCFQFRPVADDLEAALATGDAAILTGTSIGPSAGILSGLGGVGKTQVAASLARRMRDGGELDLLVWVSAQSRDAILTGFAEAAYEVIGADASNPEKAATAFLAYLAATTSRWLIVFDDLADPTDLDGCWPPRTPTGRVVVTTRRRDAGLVGHGRIVPVDLFTAEEADAYLSAKFHHRPHRLVQAGELAADLGLLPVALAQAAAFIADRDLTCATYRARLAQHPLAKLAPDVWPDEYVRSVAVTLVVSVELADQLEPVGLARPLMTVLSLLDSNGIPAELVTSAPVVGYLAHAVAQVVDPAKARDALACLTRLNLADTSGVTAIGEDFDPVGGHWIRVHALVQRAIRDHAWPDALAGAASAAADGLVNIWPQVERDKGLAHALRANTAALRANAEDQLWKPDGRVLLLRAGRSLGEAGLVTTAIDYFDALVGQASRVLGPDDPDTLATRGDLARWRGEAGDAAGAAAASEALLADQVRVLGADHPDTMATSHNLAYWRGAVGDAAGAVAALDALLVDRLRVLGPDHPKTMDSRGDLARWRGEAGDAVGAVTAFEALLADQMRMLGPDHPRTLVTRYNLALWRGTAGDAAGAAAASEALLADVQRVLGPDHPQTLATRGNLAYWRGEAGDTFEAAAASDALLADQVRVLGADHPHTLGTRSRLAHWRGAAGDAAGAAAAFEALLADRLRLLGPDHPDTLGTRSRLAHWRAAAGDVAGAPTAPRLRRRRWPWRRD